MINEFRGKKVLIMGLGLHGRGVGVVKFFAKHKARITITDLRTKEELSPTLKKIRHIPYTGVFGKHRLKEFKRTDLIIKNPAVPWSSPYLIYAENRNIPIDTDVGIFFKYTKARLIGVTGSKGKSTTTTLIYRILKKKYKNIWIAGLPQSSFLDCIGRKGIGVLELSSWDLEGMSLHKKSPHTAVITNILPEHLNRYKNLSAYQEAKKLIFLFQTSHDTLILNYDDPVSRLISKRRLIPCVYVYSKKRRARLKNVKCGTYLDSGRQAIRLEGKKVEEIALTRLGKWGKIYLENILAASTVGFLEDVGAREMAAAVSSFQGLRGRMENIGSYRGVTYINDTCATMPDATLFGLEKIKKQKRVGRTMLICGGENKNLRYASFAKDAARLVHIAFLLPGSASRLIAHSWPKKSTMKKKLIPVGNVLEGVKRAARISRSGDVVLMSPGAASFNQFRHEFERGEAFKKAFRSLHGRSKT